MPKQSRRSQNGSSDRKLASPDGIVTFTMKRTSRGIHVRRSERMNGDSHVVFSVLFVDRASFERFCDTDQQRFSYALLYQEIRRVFDELLPLP